MSTAVVLSSGGINSATVLEIALRAHRPDSVHMLSFKHESKSNDQECLASLDLYHYYRDHNENVTWTQVELPDLFYTVDSTVNPGRTFIPFLDANLLSMATTIAINKKANYVYTGMGGNEENDNLGVMAAAIYAGSSSQISLKFPLLWRTKAEIIKFALKLELPINLTWSCSQPVPLKDDSGFIHCGECLKCIDRINGFDEVSVIDPIAYAVGIDWYPMYKSWPHIGEKQLRAGLL